MISLSKLLSARLLATETEVPAVLAVQFQDKAMYTMLHNVECSIGFGGRSDRNDWQDQEPVVFINMSEFKEI